LSTLPSNTEPPAALAINVSYILVPVINGHHYGCVNLNYVCLPVEEVIAVTMKCSGQDTGNLRVALHKSPDCGGEVVIFSAV